METCVTILPGVTAALLKCGSSQEVWQFDCRRRARGTLGSTKPLVSQLGGHGPSIAEGNLQINKSGWENTLDDYRKRWDPSTYFQVEYSPKDVYDKVEKLLWFFDISHGRLSDNKTLQDPRRVTEIIA